MSADPITAGIDLIHDVLDKYIPDPTQRDAAKLAIEQARASADQAQSALQAGTNTAEASSPSTFVAGWRPMVGWVAATSLGCVYIPKALVLTGIWTYQAIVLIHLWMPGVAVPQLPAYPDLGVTDLLGLMGSMLGIGTLRTVEKVKGVA